MPTCSVAAAGATERIQLVDKNDCRRMLPSLLEQITNPGSTDTDEHLDKLRAGDREERDPCLASDGTGEQCLPGPRRADQQHTLRGAAAETPVCQRVLQEIDDLDQFVLGLIDAGDIGEGDFGLLLDIDLGAALADRHQPAEPALPHAPDRKHPDPDKEY